MEIRGQIGFSEEQGDLLEVAVNFCRDKSPVDKVRALLTDDLGYDPEVWSEVAELGWLGIAIPEEFGGVGLGLAEVVPVVEQMGRNLMAGPFVSTTLAAQAILVGGTDEQKADLLPAFASGMPAALALSEDHADWDLNHITCTAKREGDQLVLTGTKTLVTDADAAKWILVSVSLDGEPQLVLIDRSSVPDSALRREVVIDETRRSYQITLDGITLQQTALLDPAKSAETLAHLHLTANLLLSAEMCGGAASAIDYTVDYLQTRKQFGKTIGSYQSLKHPIVDAHVDYEKARSHLYSAAYTFSQQGEGEIATRMAKSTACKAFAFAADRAIQFHGGFGFTYDCDAQLYRRRAIWCEAMQGDGAYHRKKLADLLL